MRRRAKCLLAVPGNQIDRGMFAAAIDFDFKFEPVTFVQVRHPGAFDGRDMHERVGLAIVTLDKAEPLHGIEEFHRAAGFFTRQRALRRAKTTGTASATGTTARCARPGITITRRCAVGNRHRFTIDFQIGRRNPAAAIDEREAQRLPFGKPAQPGLFNRRDVHEHIFAAIITDDKAKALLPVEEFDDAGAFANDLRWHPAARAAAAAESTTAAAATAAKSAATAAAKAITAAAATAETIAATTAAAAKAAAVTAAKAAAATFVTAETIALVAATSAAFTATTFIETHAVPVSLRL
jgi:hypothetical protein